jgi:hypothetical protein
LGERIKVRGKPFEIISTLTPALSRWRERGHVFHKGEGGIESYKC